MRSKLEFEQLAQSHYADLYRYAYWLCRDRDTAADLVQETYLRAWRFFDRLEDPKKAKSWLITTLRREYARYFEKQAILIADVDLETLPAPAGHGQPDVSEWALQSALEQVPIKYREPLLLQVILGLSGEEIGELLGIPRATVNTRLFRARQALKKLLRPSEDAHDPSSTSSSPKSR
ncbi:MAG: sigma-70 family RNA polymerase sigma factor [Gammaproteobacteria bacterium]|nr:sigma-70 family RNA polymerase sigma factor [Gammaproteobacteria bacterium]